MKLLGLFPLDPDRWVGVGHSMNNIERDAAGFLAFRLGDQDSQGAVLQLGPFLPKVNQATQE